MVRRGGHYFVKNDLSTGVASSDFFYGDPGDVVLLDGGPRTGGRGDTLGVRRGGTYYLRHSLTSGQADRVLAYGDPVDTAFSGDWNGDGLDTLGVRRTQPRPGTPGSGTGRLRSGRTSRRARTAREGHSTPATGSSCRASATPWTTSSAAASAAPRS